MKDHGRQGLPTPRWPFSSVRVKPGGWAAVGLAIVGYGAGVALGYRQLIVAGAAGMIALVCAALYASWRPKVEIGRSFHPKTVVVGESAVALLEVTNHAGWPSPRSTVVDRLGGQDVALPVRALAPGGSALVRYALPTARRGRVPLGPVRVVRADPVGLLAAEQTHGGHEVLWVHPRTWPMSVLPAGVIVDLEGPVSDTALQGSLTFSSLREYVAGDDRRQIHWRTSARTGTLMVRQHVDTNEPRTTVVLDARPHVWSDETFESGVEVAASVAKALGANGQPVALHVLGQDPDQARRDGAVSIADRLAAATLSSIRDPAAMLSLIERSQGGSLVVVSGRLEPAVEIRIGAHTRSYSPVVVCRVEPGQTGSWHRRGGMLVVRGSTASSLTDAWNRMVRR